MEMPSPTTMQLTFRHILAEGMLDLENDSRAGCSEVILDDLEREPDAVDAAVMGDCDTAANQMAPCSNPHSDIPLPRRCCFCWEYVESLIIDWLDEMGLAYTEHLADLFEGCWHRWMHSQPDYTSPVR